jgi:heat shock protein HslJ
MRRTGEAALIAAGRWILVELNERPLLPDTTITAQFAPDGTIAGSAGCNRYRSIFKTFGDSFTTGLAATTRMSGAPSVMQQETEFLAALRSVRTHRLLADRLEMKDAAGRTVLLFATNEVREQPVQTLPT